MSRKRVCDCGCHEQGYYENSYVIEDDEAFNTFAGVDVCEGCLKYCDRWKGQVAYDPSEKHTINEMLKSSYIDKLELAINSPLFKEHTGERGPVTFKIKKN